MFTKNDWKDEILRFVGGAYYFKNKQKSKPLTLVNPAGEFPPWLPAASAQISAPSAFHLLGAEVGSFVLGSWHLAEIHYDPFHAEVNQKETKLKQAVKKPAWNQVS